MKIIYSVAFGIGSACVAAAGTIITPFFYISPTVREVFIITAFVIVVLGGLGSFLGTFFGVSHCRNRRISWRSSAPWLFEASAHLFHLYSHSSAQTERVVREEACLEMELERYFSFGSPLF